MEEKDHDGEVKQPKDETPRYLTLKELSKSYQNRKRKIVKSPQVKKKFIPANFVQNNSENTVIYVSLNIRNFFFFFFFFFFPSLK